jgi:hypothetical protein
MPLFLMVMRSAVIIVSHISEQNNDYVASARSGVCEQYYCELYAARPQYEKPLLVRGCLLKSNFKLSV